MDKLGNWAFIVGFIVAILAGLVMKSLNLWVVSLLVILGIIVGFLNVTQKEATPFLVASIALLAAGTADLGMFQNYINLSQALDAIGIFVAPAAIIVAIKQVYSLAAKR
jgi:hypothetical protein